MIEISYDLEKASETTYLQGAVAVVLEEFDKTRNDAGLDDLVYRRVRFSGQELAELLRGIQLFFDLGAVQGLNHHRSNHWAVHLG